MSDLTSNQLRRVDAWIAENLFGWQRWEFAFESGTQVNLMPPTNWAGAQDSGCLVTNKPLTAWHDGCVKIPRFTDPGAPRSLLDGAIAKCVEKAGGSFIAAFIYLFSYDRHRDFHRWTSWFNSIDNNYLRSRCLEQLLRASPVQICHALVLALGGNWEEVIGE